MSSEIVPKLKIGEFSQVKGGKRMPAGTALVSSKTNHPYLRIVDFREGSIDKSNLQYVPDEVFPSISRYTISTDDIYISIVGTIGLVGTIPAELNGANLTENAAKICKINKSIVDRDYLGYFLRSQEGQRLINSMAVGSTQPKLALFRIEQIEVPCPALEVQKSISQTLRALDDRITLLRETNTTLEAIAQALFKSWFVDFDPVHAKQQGRAPEGMDAQTAALFPDSFEESELGMVPKGWKVGTIGAACTLGRGASPRPIQNFMDGEIPWIKIADATASDGLFIFETVEKVTAAGAQKSVFVSPGDLILSNSASCGIPTFVDIHGCIHDGWLYFRDFSFTEKYFLFFWLKKISQHLINIADGSVQKNLNTKLVSSQPILIPPENIRKYFESFIESFFVAVKENCKRSMRLVELRDTLLPRLISGQLRLPEAQALVEEAVDD